MSYRAFKRLLGETSLERKCRFLFGAFILLLITGSFWLYAWRMEDLAYDQLNTFCRFLVRPLVLQEHVGLVFQEPIGKDGRRGAAEPALSFGHDADPKYKYRFIKPEATRPEHKHDDSFELELLQRFQNNPEGQQEAHRSLEINDANHYVYYRAVRAQKDCLVCHKGTSEELKDGGLLALIKIDIPTESIENGMHLNRAVLISTALLTALLIMSGSYIIVRYVIVKPVKHLKEVSDAISAGELNVRSEIQTGDEFEDLSHAFNRMLRNLVSMQDRLRKVNSDLDRKVDELAQANLALYESNRLKGDFLATMSHELRTPLNSILGFSEVLLSNNQLNEKQLRWLRNIQSSGERLLNLINDILDLAKIEAGKMQVRVSEFSVYDVCEGLLNMFRPLAEKKNIDLRSVLQPGAPVMRQDVVKVQQIVSNLLSNAIKFTPEGGRVLLEVETTPREVTLTVTDTGVGIAPEDQELIFEKFRQSGNPMTREQGGTGLGLSIVRELSKLLGGEVTLQSELGRGSTFLVRLPLQLSEEPRLEFDLAHEGIDLSKAQRVDVRLYAGSARTRLDPAADTQIERLSQPIPNEVPLSR